MNNKTVASLVWKKYVTGNYNQLCEALCQVSVQSNKVNGNAWLIACQDPSVGESGNTIILKPWRVANMTTFV